MTPYWSLPRIESDAGRTKASNMSPTRIYQLPVKTCEDVTHLRSSMPAMPWGGCCGAFPAPLPRLAPSRVHQFFCCGSRGQLATLAL